MSKLLGTLIAGCFIAGMAQAQQNPPGAAVPPATPGVATSKGQEAAESRKDMRPKGQVKEMGGDMPKNEKTGAVVTDKAAVTGERRAETRDQRRPGKTDSSQGGTPK